MSPERRNILEQAKVYHHIKARLRGQLGDRWPAGARLPPIKDLARQLKAGQTNTHRAVKELVREGLLVSRSGQGTFVTDLVKPQSLPGQSMSVPALAGRSALSGMWVEVLTHSAEPDLFLRRSIEVIRSRLGELGCRVTQGSAAGGERNMLPSHRESNGLVVLNPNFYPVGPVAPRQVLVVVDTSLETTVPGEGGYDIVTADSQQGGFVAGDHLAKLGCLRPCFLGCPPKPETKVQAQYDFTSTVRLFGFELGYGKAVSADYRLLCGNYQTMCGAEAVSRFLELSPRPDAIFAASDDLAIGFVHGAMAHGLEAGKHYQIVGFDSQQRGRDLPSGPLSSVEIPSEEMGMLAAELMAARLLDPHRSVRRVGLGCKLFQGVTTAAAAVAGKAAR